MRSETPHLLPRRLCGGSSRARRRNREATQAAEPVTKAVPPVATIDVRLTMTVRVVPMAESKVNALERIFVPMHEILAAGLPAPEV
jgi:hypothetical protein